MPASQARAMLELNVEHKSSSILLLLISTLLLLLLSLQIEAKFSSNISANTQIQVLELNNSTLISSVDTNNFSDKTTINSSKQDDDDDDISSIVAEPLSLSSSSSSPVITISSEQQETQVDNNQLNNSSLNENMNDFDNNNNSRKQQLLNNISNNISNSDDNNAAIFIYFPAQDSNFLNSYLATNLQQQQQEQQQEALDNTTKQNTYNNKATLNPLTKSLPILTSNNLSIDKLINGTVSQTVKSLLIKLVSDYPTIVKVSKNSITLKYYLEQIGLRLSQNFNCDFSLIDKASSSPFTLTWYSRLISEKNVSNERRRRRRRDANNASLNVANNNNDDDDDDYKRRQTTTATSTTTFTFATNDDNYAKNNYNAADDNRNSWQAQVDARQLDDLQDSSADELIAASSSASSSSSSSSNSNTNDNDFNNADEPPYCAGAQAQSSAKAFEWQCFLNFANIPNNLCPLPNKLILRSTNITTIERSALVNYKQSLSEISLEAAPMLSRIEFGAFEGLQNLRIVYIRLAPNLTSFDSALSGTYKHFTQLRIQYTSLSRWPNLSEFKSNRKLRSIDLNNNKIESLGAQPILVRTELLNLENNKLTRINAFVFDDSEITILALSGNAQLTFIDERAFEKLRGLSKLSLSNTRIATIPSLGLSNLRDLYATNVQTLRSLPPVLELKALENASLTFAHHCCAFLHPNFEVAQTTSHACASTTSATQSTNVESLTTTATATSQSSLGATLAAFFADWLFVSQYHNKQCTSTSNINIVNSNTYYNNNNIINKSLIVNAYNNKKKIEEEEEEEAEAEAEQHFNATLQREQPPTFERRGRLHAVNCSPQPNAFNPCEDIISYSVLRVAIWFVVGASVCGNLSVIVVLLNVSRLNVARFLQLNLALADLCMGVYVLLLASADLLTAGVYFNYAHAWQFGVGCSLAGALSVFGSQLSIFTLTVLTFDRYYAIIYSLDLNMRLKLNWAAKIVFIGWLLCFCSALLPIFANINSYSMTSICLPLRTQTKADIIYIGTLLAIDATAFAIILNCYIRMYLLIRRQKTQATAKERTVAMRMALLVLTDFACWAPIIFFGLTALAKKPLISVTNSKILIVFFYPLNSMANPFLYVILTRQYKRDCNIFAGKLANFKRKLFLQRQASTQLQQQQTASNTSNNNLNLHACQHAYNYNCSSARALVLADEHQLQQQQQQHCRRWQFNENNYNNNNNDYSNSSNANVNIASRSSVATQSSSSQVGQRLMHALNIVDSETSNDAYAKDVELYKHNNNNSKKHEYKQLAATSQLTSQLPGGATESAKHNNDDDEQRVLALSELRLVCTNSNKYVITHKLTRVPDLRVVGAPLVQPAAAEKAELASSSKTLQQQQQTHTPRAIRLHNRLQLPPPPTANNEGKGRRCRRCIARRAAAQRKLNSSSNNSNSISTKQQQQNTQATIEQSTNNQIKNRSSNLRREHKQNCPLSQLNSTKCNYINNKNAFNNKAHCAKLVRRASETLCTTTSNELIKSLQLSNNFSINNRRRLSIKEL